MTQACAEAFRLRPGVAVTTSPAGELLLEAPPHTVSLGPATEGLCAIVSMLAEKPSSAEMLATASEGHEGAPGPDVQRLLDRLTRGGWVTVDVAYGRRPLYTVRPVRAATWPKDCVNATEVVLSRFALIHRDEGALVAESPRSWCEIRIHDPSLMEVLAALAQPASADRLRLSLPDAVTRRLLADLRRADLVVPVGDVEETELRLRQWSPFELWMHSRSRLDLRADFNGGWGATGWAEGVFPPLPSRHEAFGGAFVELYRPDVEALRETDPSLTSAVEDRRSLREHDDKHPLTVEQLGEFLYRCARVRHVEVIDGVEHLDRPFPSGGALHELELYPVVRRVRGLDPGLYHYDAHGHWLERITGDEAPVRRLVETAELATSSPSAQVVIVLAARFGRLMAKYEGIGYAAVLKNVGVLYQTMYLVATAMGLAPCAIGGGDATTLNDGTGLDYFAESAVGEFLLGSRAQADAPTDGVAS